MVSNDRLENGKCLFRVTSLNLSHNRLSHFLNYIVELDLISPDLERLDLVSCEINDEQIISMISSEKLQHLEHLDLTSNHLEKTYTLLLKYLRDTCGDHLKNLFLRDIPGLKYAQNNFQIAKAKKNSGLSLIVRLDLCRSLRGDVASG